VKVPLISPAAARRWPGRHDPVRVPVHQQHRDVNLRHVGSEVVIHVSKQAYAREAEASTCDVEAGLPWARGWAGPRGGWGGGPGSLLARGAERRRCRSCRGSPHVAGRPATTAAMMPSNTDWSTPSGFVGVSAERRDGAQQHRPWRPWRTVGAKVAGHLGLAHREPAEHHHAGPVLDRCFQSR